MKTGSHCSRSRETLIINNRIAKNGLQLKTNATRQLDRLGIPYELRDYEVDPNDLGALKVAHQIGLPPNQVFKTLCAKADDATVVLAVVPGDQELDLKALARLAAKRGMELVPVSRLQPLTGYIRGGVTALACKKNYPVYLDHSALQHRVIAVSAGVRGTQIVLSPQDYIRSTAAVTGSIGRAPSCQPNRGNSRGADKPAQVENGQ